MYLLWLALILFGSLWVIILAYITARAAGRGWFRSLREMFDRKD